MCMCVCVTSEYAQKSFPPVGIRYVKRGIETKETRIFNKGENCWPLSKEFNYIVTQVKLIHSSCILFNTSFLSFLSTFYNFRKRSLLI